MAEVVDRDSMQNIVLDGIVTTSLVAVLIGCAVLVPGEVDHDHSMDEHTPGRTDASPAPTAPAGTRS